MSDDMIQLAGGSPACALISATQKDFTSKRSIDTVYQWAMSKADRNRLMHALNGNINAFNPMFSSSQGTASLGLPTGAALCDFFITQTRGGTLAAPTISTSYLRSNTVVTPGSFEVSIAGSFLICLGTSTVLGVTQSPNQASAKISLSIIRSGLSPEPLCTWSFPYQTDATNPTGWFGNSAVDFVGFSSCFGVPRQISYSTTVDLNTNDYIELAASGAIWTPTSANPRADSYSCLQGCGLIKRVEMPILPVTLASVAEQETPIWVSNYNPQKASNDPSGAAGALAANWNALMHAQNGNIDSFTESYSELDVLSVPSVFVAMNWNWLSNNRYAALFIPDDDISPPANSWQLDINVSDDPAPVYKPRFESSSSSEDTGDDGEEGQTRRQRRSVQRGSKTDKKDRFKRVVNRVSNKILAKSAESKVPARTLLLRWATTQTNDGNRPADNGFLAKVINKLEEDQVSIDPLTLTIDTIWKNIWVIMDMVLCAKLIDNIDEEVLWSFILSNRSGEYSDWPLQLDNFKQLGWLAYLQAMWNTLMHSQNGNIDGYSAAQARLHNKKMHSLNGNTDPTNVVPLDTKPGKDSSNLLLAAAQGVGAERYPANMDIYSVAKSESIFSTLTSSVTNKPGPLNGITATIDRQNFGGASGNNPRLQASTLAFTLPTQQVTTALQKTNYTAGVPASYFQAMRIENSTGVGTTVVANPTTKQGNPVMIDTQLENGGGYSVHGTPLRVRLTEKLEYTADNMTARITSLHTATNFPFNDMVMLATDAGLGVDSVSFEQLALKLNLYARMFAPSYESGYAIADTIITTPIGRLQTAAADGFLNMTPRYSVARDTWPTASANMFDQRYGITTAALTAFTNVGTPVPALTASTDSWVSLHLSTSTIFADPDPSDNIVIPLTSEFFAACGFNPATYTKYIALMASLVAPFPQIPVGYTVGEACSLNTTYQSFHVAGAKKIHFLLPADPSRWNGAPNNVSAASGVAMYKQLPVGPISVAAGVRNYFNPGATADLVAGSGMQYVALGDSTYSVEYRLSALLYSYHLNSNISLYDIALVRNYLLKVLPISSDLIYTAHMADYGAVWYPGVLNYADYSAITNGTYSPNLSVTVSSQAVPWPQTAEGAFNHLDYPRLANDAADTSRFRVQATNLKALGLLMMRMIQVSSQVTTAPKLELDASYDYLNPYFSNSLVMNALPYALAHQYNNYILGVPGYVHIQSYDATYASGSQIANFIRSLDGRMAMLSSGTEAAVQKALCNLYCNITKGHLPPRSSAGLTIFSSRLIPYTSRVLNSLSCYQYANQIPSTLPIISAYIISQKLVREYTPFPIPDLISKTTFLPMGNELTITPYSWATTFSVPFVKTEIALKTVIRSAYDECAYIDGDQSWNLDLWASVYSDTNMATNIRMYETATGAILASCSWWMYSRGCWVRTRPQNTLAQGGSLALCQNGEVKHTAPRLTPTSYVIPIDISNSTPLISDYTRMTPQPRTTWVVTPLVTRPLAIYTMGAANSSPYMAFEAKDVFSVPSAVLTNQSSDVGAITENGAPLTTWQPASITVGTTSYTSGTGGDVKKKGSYMPSDLINESGKL